MSKLPRATLAFFSACLLLPTFLPAKDKPQASAEEIGDGQDAFKAAFRNAKAIAADAQGDLYISDGDHMRIRKVDHASHKISTVVGDGVYQGAQPDYGGEKVRAQDFPVAWAGSLAVDGGTLFFGQGSRILKVKDGWVTSLAGGSESGFGGDGAAAKDAQLSYAAGLVLDGKGGLVFADLGNHRLRRIDLKTGIIQTLAGNGSETFSGDGGPGLQAGIQPEHLCADKAGNLYFSQEHRVRKWDRATGKIGTVAGSGALGMSGDQGPALKAAVEVESLASDGAGNLYIQGPGLRLRRVKVADGSIDTLYGAGNTDILSVGHPGEVGISGINAMAADPQGGLVLMGSSDNIEKAYHFDPAKAVFKVLAGPLKAPEAHRSQSPQAAMAADPKLAAMLAQMMEAEKTRLDTAFKAQTLRDTLEKLQGNSVFADSYRPLPGAPVLLQVGVKRWDAVAGGSRGLPARVHFQVTGGEGSLQALDSFDPTGPKAQALDLTATADSAAVWLFAPAEKTAKLQVKASLAAEGMRKDYRDPASAVLFDLEPQAAGLVLPSVQALNQAVQAHCAKLSAVTFVQESGRLSATGEFKASRRVLEFHQGTHLKTLTCELDPATGASKSCTEFDELKDKMPAPFLRSYPGAFQITHVDAQAHKAAGFYWMPPIANGTTSAVFEELDLTQPELGPSRSRQFIMTPQFGIDSKSETLWSQPVDKGGFRYWSKMDMAQQNYGQAPGTYESRWQVLHLNGDASPGDVKK